MTSDELVSVMVPREHLAAVYGFVATLDQKGSPARQSRQDNGHSAEHSAVPDEWTPSRIRRAVQESPPAMQHILRALAEHPGEWLSTRQFADAIQDNPDADWKTVAGTLGAFGRRVRSRYGLQSLPYEHRYDHTAKCQAHRMSAEVAREVVRALDAAD
jgi:hypothetical protein